MPTPNNASTSTVAAHERQRRKRKVSSSYGTTWNLFCDRVVRVPQSERHSVGGFSNRRFEWRFCLLLALLPKVGRSAERNIPFEPRNTPAHLKKKEKTPPPTFPCGFHVETLWKTSPSPTAVETFPVFPPYPVDKKWRKIRDLRPFPQKFSLLLLLRNKRLVYVVLLKIIPIFFQKGSTGKDPALC